MCCTGTMDLEELRSLLGRHARPDATTAIDGVLVSKVDRSDAPEPATTGTVLAVIAQGTKRLALGDRVLEYGAGQYLVASVDLPVTGQFLRVGPDCPALGFGLVLEPADIAELLLLAGPGDVPRAGGGTVPPSPSATRPTNCSTQWCACCGSSTGPVTAPRSRPWSSARSCGG